MPAIAGDLGKDVSSYPRVTEIISGLISSHPKLLDWVRWQERKGNDTKAILKKAGNRGTRIHKCVQNILTGKRTRRPRLFKKQIDATVAYIKTQTLTDVELSIAVDTPVPYRGTMDYVYTTTDGTIVIGDLKTGKTKSRTHALQLHAYKYGYETMTGNKVGRLELIYFGKTGLDIVEVPIQEGLWEHVLALYKYFQGYRYK